MTKTVILHGEHRRGKEYATRLLGKCPMDSTGSNTSVVMSESLCNGDGLEVVDTMEYTTEMWICLGVTCDIKCRMYHFCQDANK